MTQYRPDPRFAALGDEFSTPVEPASFPKDRAVFWNGRWADAVGVRLDEDARKAHFLRFEPLADNQAEPRAIKYHGHQFRVYNPEIGDGRGFLFAQLRDDPGRLLDLGTKGSGQTPFSRSGDGRLTLKGAVREILAAEMLEALGVYTSKIFSVFETGEPLHRGDEPSPTRSAVLTRLQHSHLRFGVFQRHAYFERPDLIEQLVDYAVENLTPEAGQGDGDKAARLLSARRKALGRAQRPMDGRRVCPWRLEHRQSCGDRRKLRLRALAFLPYLEPGFTAAYFDHHGLYAYARQPESVFWALQQLAGALALVGEREALIEALSAYPEHYKQAMRSAFLCRLGVEPVGDDSDGVLVKAFLDFMEVSQAPWEAVFFDWFCGAASQARADAGPRAALYARDDFKPVRDGLLARAPVRPERLDHPYFKRAEPIHMTIERVEALWAPIAEADDWSLYDQTLSDIAEARAAYDLGAGRAGFLAAGAP